MSFAAIGWCKQTILLTVIICSHGIKAIPALAGEMEQKKFDFDYNSLQINYQKKDSQSPQANSSCRKANIDYIQIYSFETDYYNINICQQENNFYYHRQSKLDSGTSTLIPAEAVFGGDVFKATSGKTIYFVGRDGDRHYSSVMLNNNEIVLEPELLPTPTSFSPEIVHSGVRFSFGEIKVNNLHQATNASWRTEYSQNSNASIVCIEDRSNLDSSLDDWQNLLGKSPDIANRYAVNNGHEFVYNNKFPERAAIETKEGKIVNLNIATPNETIERVCLQSTKDSI